MHSENKTWVVLLASSESMSVVDEISFVIMWWSALVFGYAFHLIEMPLVVFNCCARACVFADDRHWQSPRSARQAEVMTSSPWRRTEQCQCRGSGCAARRRPQAGCPFDLVMCCICLIRCPRLPVPPRCRFALVGATRRCRPPGARTAARREAAE